MAERTVYDCDICGQRSIDTDTRSVLGSREKELKPQFGSKAEQPIRFCVSAYFPPRRVENQIIGVLISAADEMMELVPAHICYTCFVGVMFGQQARIENKKETEIEDNK